ARTRASRPRVTLVTAPLDVLPFWNPQQAAREAAIVVSRLHRRGFSATVRVHPRDRIVDWQAAFARAGSAVAADIEFENAPPLEQVLAKTDVALMFSSTVFLDCVARGIPVVSLGWYPGQWRQALERTRAIQFARSIEQAVTLVESSADLRASPSASPGW